MPDPREQAEAVARWCGWRPIPNPYCDGSFHWTFPKRDGERKRKDRSVMPDYRSIDAMREVEDEIERRGLLERYRSHLHAAWCKDHGYAAFSLFLIRATAAQRLEAAARVIEEVSR